MSEHTERFTGRVVEYARYRRPYPAAKILRWLGAECGLEAEWGLRTWPRERAC